MGTFQVECQILKKQPLKYMFKSRLHYASRTYNHRMLPKARTTGSKSILEILFLSATENESLFTTLKLILIDWMIVFCLLFYFLKYL